MHRIVGTKNVFPRNAERVDIEYLYSVLHHLDMYVAKILYIFHVIYIQNKPQAAQISECMIKPCCNEEQNDMELYYRIT